VRLGPLPSYKAIFDVRDSNSLALRQQIKRAGLSEHLTPWVLTTIRIVGKAAAGYRVRFLAVRVDELRLNYQGMCITVELGAGRSTRFFPVRARVSHSELSARLDVCWCLRADGAILRSPARPMGMVEVEHWDRLRRGHEVLLGLVKAGGRPPGSSSRVHWEDDDEEACAAAHLERLVAQKISLAQAGARYGLTADAARKLIAGHRRHK
jgi:hypothetical protein